MEKYKCHDNTLFHSVLFNLAKLESIMKYGIVSEKYADENDINLSRNYLGYNLSDTISLTRYLYVNYNIEDSSYCSFVKKGISFIIEDVSFISSKDERILNRSDEVLVESHIPIDKIKGIMIPNEYEDEYLSDVLLISLDMTSYDNVKNNCHYLIKYLGENNYSIGLDEYSEYLKELKLINKVIGQYKDNSLENEDYQEVLFDYQDLLLDLNDYLASNLEKCFGKLLNKERVTVKEAVSYINDKYLKLPLYNIPSDSLNKRK